MIIGFWSENPGKGSVTYNMLASGLFISSKYRNKVILMQGKADYNKIDYAFVPYSEESAMKECSGYYNYGGIDLILDKLENNEYSNRELRNEIVRVRNSNLYYLPSSRISSQDVFNKRFSRVYDRYIENMRSMEELIMLELSNGFEYVSKNVLERLDLLVINISQDNKALEGIRDSRSLMEKSFFIIGRYDDSSEFNIRNIGRRYGIDESALGAIPYSVRFKDAVCMGKSKEFFERHINANRNDEAYVFMRYLKNTSEMIMKKCNCVF